MDFDVHIRGAGIGGLLPAYVWSRRGLKVVVTDPVGIGAGASGAWRTLLNPAAGVNPKPKDGLAELMEAFGQWMEAVDPRRTAAKPVALYRPATDAGLAAGFRAAAARHWDGVALRLAPPLPGIAGQEGLWVEPVWVIDTPALLALLARAVVAGGGEVRIGTDSEPPPATRRFGAVGEAVLASRPGLGQHAVKGQLRRIRTSRVLPGPDALAGRGYAVRTAPDEWIIGSTYEHRFDHPGPDSAQDAYLLRRFQALFTEPPDVEILDRWAGIRVGTPSRIPYLGPDPLDPASTLFTGLGSKGWLHSAEVALRAKWE